MKKLHSCNREKKKYIEKITNENSDVVFKNLKFFNRRISVVFSESSTSRDVVNESILGFFTRKHLYNKHETKNMLNFLKTVIPVNKVTNLKDYEEFFLLLNSGFTILFIDGEDNAIAFETKATLNSSIAPSEAEKVLKGPKDAFTENYQTNLGMIKKRIKTEKLWFEEFEVGTLSRTKVGMLYIEGIAKSKIIETIREKIKNINIEEVADSSYIVEKINDCKNSLFPTFMATERPDLVSFALCEGKVVLVVENSQLVIILPTLFLELFQPTEDLYQKPINANYTRIIRFIAFAITILTPALYIAITTFNHEIIPNKLLINLLIQREGVPLPTLLEALFMLLTFEILKETDTRIPSAIGSSLAIVGALVLGDAAVTAGIVSPIMVIIIAITSISSFIISNFDLINSVRIWRIIFMLSAGIFGMLGIMVSSLIFIINLSSIKILGIPYLMPLSPTYTKDINGGIFVSNKSKFIKRKKYIADDTTRIEEVKS